MQYMVITVVPGIFIIIQYYVKITNLSLLLISLTLSKKIKKTKPNFKVNNVKNLHK